MLGESKKPRSREELAELDRSAWNVPRPRLEPLGPVREGWPVRQKEQGRPASDERPAAP
jgi:hypothetical protein